MAVVEVGCNICKCLSSLGNVTKLIFVMPIRNLFMFLTFLPDSTDAPKKADLYMQLISRRDEPTFLQVHSATFPLGVLISMF